MHYNFLIFGAGVKSAKTVKLIILKHFQLVGNLMCVYIVMYNYTLKESSTPHNNQPITLCM